MKGMRDKVLLLVDDNPDDEDLAIRALRRVQVESQVVVARDGQEALQLLLGTGSYNGHVLPIVPDLILLDLKLPKVSGLEVLRRIRADDRTRLIPAVILSSSSEEEDIYSCYEQGANSYIRKPVNASAFTDALRQISQYWLTLNELLPRQ